MAHYALLDENNVVVQVIAGRNETESVDGITDWEAHYAEVTGMKCKRTSRNTVDGVHLDGGVAFRGNMAAKGYTYDENLDAFIAPQPYPSWTLDTTTFTWEPPVAEMPGQYNWDEEAGNWVQAPAPFPSWVWNEETAEWEAPIPFPQNATSLKVWDEDAGSWVEAQDNS